MMSRRRSAVAAFLSLLTLAGCAGLMPGDPGPGYDVGFVRVGDQLYVFAPLCEGERVVDVEVYDNSSSAQGPSYDPSSRAVKWKVAEPINDDANKGWIAVGKDKDFKVVTVPRVGVSELSGNLGIDLSINRAGVVYGTGAAFLVEDAPVYPAAADIKTLKFAYYDDSGPKVLLTTDEIRKRNNCR
jgi:hypothetical protein